MNNNNKIINRILEYNKKYDYPVFTKFYKSDTEFIKEFKNIYYNNHEYILFYCIDKINEILLNSDLKNKSNKKKINILIGILNDIKDKS